MKSARIVLISVLVATIWNAESKKMSFEQIREALGPVRKLCIERVKVDPKMIDEANKGNFVPDRKLQCYFKCMLVMTKVMTKDDEVIQMAFVRNAQLMLLDELVEPVIKAFQHCQNVAIQEIEGCELAYQMAKCYYEYDSSLVFYP